MLIPLVQVGERQQREKTRASNGGAQLTLIMRLRPGNASRHDLAVLVDEVLQNADVFVIDLLDLLDRKTAELLATKQVLRTTLLVFIVLAFALAS